MVLIVALAALIGVLLGLVGGGGSILTMPLLLYAGLETRAAIATSLVIVGVSALAALVPHALAGRVRFRAGALFGGAGMLGAHLGARVSGFVPELVLLGGFAVMMVFTAVALYRCRRCDGQPAQVTVSDSRFRHVRLPLQGFAVGVVTGLVGVGGGFLIVPALTLLAGLPTRAAVATSLFVIALNALAGFTGHLSHVTPDWAVLGPLVLACSLGGLGGSFFADRIPQRILRRGMAVVVIAVALFGVVVKARAAAAAPRSAAVGAGVGARAAAATVCRAGPALLVAGAGRGQAIGGRAPASEGGVLTGAACRDRLAVREGGRVGPVLAVEVGAQPQLDRGPRAGSGQAGADVGGAGALVDPVRVHVTGLHQQLRRGPRLDQVRAGRLLTAQQAGVEGHRQPARRRGQLQLI
jgi:uncharacterized membrane protein YfcA